MNNYNYIENSFKELIKLKSPDTDGIKDIIVFPLMKTTE